MASPTKPARVIAFRLPFKPPVWALYLVMLVGIAFLGLDLAWVAHEKHGWDWWTAGLLGTGGALLFGIALGLVMLLVQQNLVLQYQRGTFEITVKQVEVLARFLGGRSDDAKGWAKRHRLDPRDDRRRPRDINP
jgi:hypothetical protein